MLSPSTTCSWKPPPRLPKPRSINTSGPGPPLIWTALVIDRRYRSRFSHRLFVIRRSATTQEGWVLTPSEEGIFWQPVYNQYRV